MTSPVPVTVVGGCAVSFRLILVFSTLTWTLHLHTWPGPLGCAQEWCLRFAVDLPWVLAGPRMEKLTIPVSQSEIDIEREQHRLGYRRARGTSKSFEGSMTWEAGEHGDRAREWAWSMACGAAGHGPMAEGGHGYGVVKVLLHRST